MLLRHNGDMSTVDTISLDFEGMQAFCRRHGIRELAAFGSVLRTDFGPDSDIDLLVDFLPGRTPGLLGLASMELELEEAFGREVELRTYEDLSPSFRDEVRRRARRLYAA